MEKLKVIDLFAGAGGLSLGFQQTDKFEIKVAFENNPSMRATYKRNHPEVDVRGDVCVADYDGIREEYGTIDVVIGGPPCQGFSNANRQKNHAISQNNMLVKQYIRAITELQPKAFVMENVSMLRSDVHRFYLYEQDIELIDRYNIPVKESRLILLEGKYAFEGALDIVQTLERIDALMWPENHYSALNVVFKAAKNTEKLMKALKKYKNMLLSIADFHDLNMEDDYVCRKSSEACKNIKKYYQNEIDSEELIASIEPVIMIQRMLYKAKEIFDNHLVVEEYFLDGNLCAKIKSFAVFDYLKTILEASPNNYTIAADVLCAADFGAPQKRNRFVVIGIKKSLAGSVELPNGKYNEKNYRTVRDAISDLEDVNPVIDVSNDKGISLNKKNTISALGKQLRDTDLLHNHVITNTRKTAMERFKALKQGQNFHALDDSLKTNTYTDVSRTQNTIYLRLDYDQPSGTVVNVRKSMWVHPVLDRAVSIREAARLQTFPDSFVFCGTKDSQYQQVGNAVPPIMAKEIANELAMQLKRCLKGRNNDLI